MEASEAEWAQWGIRREGGSAGRQRGGGHMQWARELWGRGAVRDRRRQGGVGWADGHVDAGRKRRNEHRSARIGSLGE